ncbi:MAG TPA: alpha/beta hydrolase [Mucilaginibacter sp.]|jgi:pimeloyl-ACP methyl ester carboxylesterase|nr:alpha/beta hydrolase [Mucilaginibacter sp.]
MQRVILIPGLGADYRVFQNIDLSGYEVINIIWLEPEKADTLTSYAQNLIDHYHIRSADILIGNSLGGMLSIEIAKKIHPRKTVLISSIKTVHEAPASHRWYRRIPLYKLLPSRLYTSTGFLVRFAMGKVSKKHHALFIDMLKKTSPSFARWAIGAILHWNNEIIPEHVYHIHGNKDRIFPYKRVKDATIIKGGTHLMVMNKPKELNNWLKNILTA